MGEAITVGLDLAKNIFQVHGVGDGSGARGGGGVAAIAAGRV